MFEALRALIGNRRVVPVAPLGFVPTLPDEDDEQSAWDDEGEAPELETISGVGCVVSYLSGKGEQSMRRVTCRRLSTKGAALYLQAYCHERDALRTFRVDRMVEVACGATGEVFTPGLLFFERFEVASEGGAVVGFGLGVQAAADLRAALNILAFLARADGHAVPEEHEVVECFCQAFALRYGSADFDYEGTCRYAMRLAPDAETFYLSMDRLKREKAPTGLAALTKRYAGDLIEADGQQHPEEFYFGREILEFL